MKALDFAKKYVTLADAEVKAKEFAQMLIDKSASDADVAAIQAPPQMQAYLNLSDMDKQKGTAFMREYRTRRAI
jgi:hypothetical protein